MNGRTPRPKTYDAVKEALVEEWNALTSEDYSGMIVSMSERVKAVLQKRRRTHAVVDDVGIVCIALTPTVKNDLPRPKPE